MRVADTSAEREEGFSNQEGTSFRVHEVRGYIETIFIVEYKESILVLDGGCKCDAVKVEEFITQRLNRSMDCVRAIVVSHTHPDHAGGAPVLSKRHNIPIAAPWEINRWYAGFRGFLQHKVDIILAHWFARRQNRSFKSIINRREIRIDYPLYENSRVPFFEDWRVIEVPGHTTHDIVLYNEKASILYAGDMILNVNRKFWLPYPVAVPALMRTSIEKLASLKIDTLLMAHGKRASVLDFSEIAERLLCQINKPIDPLLQRLLPLQRFSRELKTERIRAVNSGLREYGAGPWQQSEII